MSSVIQVKTASVVSATSLALTWDATLGTGNLVVLIVQSLAAVDLPSGWTEEERNLDIGSFGNLYSLFWKNSAAETSVTVDVTSGSTKIQIISWEFDGLDTTTPFSTNTAVSNGEAGPINDVAAGAFTAANANSTYITFAGVGDDSINISDVDTTVEGGGTNYTNQTLTAIAGAGKDLTLAAALLIDVSGTPTHDAWWDWNKIEIELVAWLSAIQQAEVGDDEIVGSLGLLGVGL